MKVLITGASGTGKSTVASLLRARGLKAIETDYDDYIAYWEHITTGEREYVPEPFPADWFAMHHWKWNVDTLRDVLARSPETTFVCGDSRNKAEAFSLFDKLFVLKLDDAALIDRLISRTNNPYGKTVEEREWAIAENESTVTRLTEAGATVIDASQPAERVVDEILAAVHL